MYRLRRRQTGFTLVEILVSLLIFGIISVLSYRALDAVFALEQRQADDYAGRMQIQRAWAIILNDLIHLRARPIRDQRGGVEGAYVAPAGDYLVSFTRGGLPALATIPGGLQRVAYDVSDESELRRWVWPSADQADGVEPVLQVLLEDVDDIRFEHLDRSNFFSPVWPPVNQNNAPLNSVPRMLKVSLTMLDGEELERLVPGVENPL